MYDLSKDIESLVSMSKGTRMCNNFPRHIHHIRFPVFKNIEQGARLEFPFPVTALVGANGSGKTSVLNALYGAPDKHSTGEYWFSTQVDPIEEGLGSPNRFIYGHYNQAARIIVETRKARVRKTRNGRLDPNYWEPTKEAPGDNMEAYAQAKPVEGRSLDRWNPVKRGVLYINFRRELSAFDKYFYFGKAPPKPRKGDKTKRRIQNKKDRVRADAVWLAKVIAAGNTSITRRNLKVATENRALTAGELKVVSYVLGHGYTDARWIKHRLFDVDGGLSIIFKTSTGTYSEAFAGSGEVAVTSCVIQILKAREDSLVLLDEPEVSLHPGAQERLLAFLVAQSKLKRLQVIFSTHSPFMLTGLPDNAIKAFDQGVNGKSVPVNSSHPYAAFVRLGAPPPGKLSVLVEDSLAKTAVEQAIALLPTEADRSLFIVEVVSGGYGGILSQRVPALLGSRSHLVLLDGDARKVDEFLDPDAIAADQNKNLDKLIVDSVGVSPSLLVDGGNGKADKKKKGQVAEVISCLGTRKRGLPSTSLSRANRFEGGRLGGN